ncbi:MAG: gamma-glutamyl-gamma-aminobutyrate hydrolase family protein [Acidimicrobiales bacterium]
MAPLIGITGRRLGAHRLAGVSPAMATAEIDVHFSEYGAAVAAAGGVPVQLTRDAPAPEVVARLDGLLLSGGADVDPRRYGARPGPRLGEVEPDRDEWELALVAAALETRRPILGVCRGAQLLNVACGGTLVADLAPDEGEGHPNARRYPRHHRLHRVRLAPGSAVAAAYGGAEELWVNSLHHQAVDRPGEGVTVVGCADDGVVEAIELAGRAALGVQWHPEALREPDPIFAWLTAAAAR